MYLCDGKFQGSKTKSATSVKKNPNKAFFSSRTDITAEEFVNRPKIGEGTSDYGKSKYDLFREKIARKLRIPTGNVQIFTVRNHPTMPRTVDIRFAAHGSPYYRPARLDGIVNQFKMEVRFELFHNKRQVSARLTAEKQENFLGIYLLEDGWHFMFVCQKCPMPV